MQNKKPTVFIIAGEVSGDILGSHIMAAAPDMEFIGVGGENMVAAGLRPIFPLGDLAVMGVVEVLAHARTLTRRIRQTVDAIIASKPDIVVTIDSPGFARSVIKSLRKSAAGRHTIAAGLRFHHVVAPQVWAWRAGRAKKYAKTFDKLYAFFDFEVPYFTKYGLDTVAVGHPIAPSLIGQYKNNPAAKTIALIPGSRMSEVKRLMPIYRDVAAELDRCGFAGYKFVIPTVETTAEYIARETDSWATPVELIPADKRYELYAKTFVAIAASGTVSAELAMIHTPAIVVYRMNPITLWIARRVISVRWVSLVNILLNRGVYPELLGGAANVRDITGTFCRTAQPNVRRTMVSTLREADDLWRRPNGTPAELIADGIRTALTK